MNILLILMLIGTLSSSVSNQHHIPPELLNSHTKNQSKQELTTRISELESLLRKKNRLLELKDEQIIILEKELDKKYN